jgi:hypothetical protein
VTRSRIALVCLPIALGGLALAVHAGVRVRAHERSLAALKVEVEAAGDSFVDTLQGQHLERQRLVLDRRRELALAAAAARRDALLGAVAALGAGILAAGLAALGRISREIEEDRRHVRAASGEEP